MVLPENFRKTMQSIFLDQELPKITNLDLTEVAKKAAKKGKEKRNEGNPVEK